MPQLSYPEAPAVAYPGMIADTGLRDIITGVAASKQLEQVVVTTVENSGVFTVTINGTVFDITADGSATKTEIRDALVTDINAGDEPVVAAASASDTFTIESTDFDAGFTISVTNPSTGVLTVTHLVAQEQSIPFAKCVVWDEKGDDIQVRLPRLTGDITAGTAFGVAMADVSKQIRSTAPYGGYSAGEALPIVRKGRIWVISENAVATVGLQAYVRFSASGSEELGSFRTDADTSDAAALPRCTFRTTCEAGGLTVLEMLL